MEESQVSTDKTPPTSPARVRRSGGRKVESSMGHQVRAIFIFELERESGMYLTD